MTAQADGRGTAQRRRLLPLSLSLVRAAAVIDGARDSAVRPTPERLPASAVQEGRLTYRSQPQWLAALVRRIVLGDAVASLIAAGVAVFFRFGGEPAATYVLLTVAFPFVWVLACLLTRSYEPRFLGTGSEEYRRVFDAGLRLLAGAAIASYAFRLQLARLYVVVAFPLAILLTLLTRYAMRQSLHRARAAGDCQHKVIVVGRERSVAEMVRQLRLESYAGFDVVGACVDRSQGPVIEGVPVVGTSSTVVEALQRTGADTVAVGAWSDLTQADLRRLSWRLEGSGVDLVVAPSLTDVAGPRIHIRPVSGLPLLHIEEPEFTGGRRVVKAVFDRSAAALALFLLLPALVVVAVAVRLDSPGPALFRQTRVGADGKRFTMFKFRSMRADAEVVRSELAEENLHRDSPLFKLRDDPRVTRIGRVLRRTSLDELPQLWNVLRGDMSLVGPRPPLPREVDEYGYDAHRRLLVKPGVTGLWQVSGRSELSWDETVRLDLHYVESWSLALDVMILWKTLFAVTGRRGAY